MSENAQPVGAGAPGSHDAYFKRLHDEFTATYEVAKRARAKQLDPEPLPESIVTADVAERVEKAVGPPGIAARIRELSKDMQRELMAFRIAEEIVKAHYDEDPDGTVDQAVRTAAAILDEAVTAAPIQGINSVKIRQNADGSEHLVIYYAGPIRSAGGTDMALSVVIADVVRVQAGLAKYKATELEAKRFVEEARVYEREVARFQFHVSDDEMYNAFLNLPVEVNGVETDKVEVSTYRNVPRIETNRVRSGCLLVVRDGIVGRSRKVLNIIDGLKIQGWEWLRTIRPPSDEPQQSKELMFMEDVVGGRPIFAFPGARGGFRLRYGRSRNTGLSAIGVHPSTMLAFRNFIACGTQIKTQLPGKAGIAAAVNTIEPPVVRLKDGSVLRLDDPAKAAEVVDSVDKILFVGDILVGFGEFLENNRPLVPSGFVEEWWIQLAQAKAAGDANVEGASAKFGVEAGRMREILADWHAVPTPDEALAMAKTGIPLHPRYTYFWNDLPPEDFDYLRGRLLDSALTSLAAGRLITVNEPRAKQILEVLCVPHRVEGGSVVLDAPEAKTLGACAGLNAPSSAPQGQTTLERLASVSGMTVMPKAPIYVGARMGRPEKARRREMKPLIHCLFPVGLAGGPRRNIVDAAKKPPVKVEIAYRKCPKCSNITYRFVCEKCGDRTIRELVCSRCGQEGLTGKTCPACKAQTRAYSHRNVAIQELFDAAVKNIGMADPPALVKGVQGLISEDKVPEPLEKGLLRAAHNLSIFRDGTVRYDATNAPLTHFRPMELGTSLEKVRALGYATDMHGKPLESEEQTCALNIHDLLVSEDCGDYMVRVSQFLDDLLQRFYGLPPFYNAKTRDDLVGQLILGLSPHTSVGVIGRIIGYHREKVCFAHPFWHAAKRRDCDGDEDSVSLALDILINFSRKFLSARVGGIMDASMLLTVAIKPKEIARQVYNIETVDQLPLKFYEEAAKGAEPKMAAGLIETVSQRLASSDPNLVLDSMGFTQDAWNINEGNRESAYTTLDTMLDKTTAQLDLADAIRAVDASEVARRVLSTHFMRDLMGNLKAFAGQRFRCTKCNAKFRRVPLRGVCARCGSKLSLTVYKGGVLKYLKVAKDIVKRYNLGTYHEQRLQLLDDEIVSLFGTDLDEPQEEKAKASPKPKRATKAERSEKAEKKDKEKKAQISLSQFV